MIHAPPNPRRPRVATARRAATLRSRAFTLIETLVVITIFGIIAVTVSPSMVRMLRDRRVQRAAAHLSDVYRTARTRAMGRGLPMLVTYTTSGQQGIATIIEPLVTTQAAAATCQTTQWTNFGPPGTAGAVQEYYRINLTQGLYQPTQLKFDDDATPSATQTFHQTCFMPSGRTYTRAAANGTFAPMRGVITISVTNTDSGLVRKVLVPPSGVARIQL